MHPSVLDHDSAFSSFNVVEKDFYFNICSVYELNHLHTGSFSNYCVKNNLSVFIPHITAIVNASINNGIISRVLKRAGVTPVLKMSGNDAVLMSNYRPISNLPFLAKGLECLVVGQLQTPLHANTLFERFQSGFRSGHSTETTLVKVMKDLSMITDSRACGILIL